MALTPQNSDAFFREVDEEVRRDQMIGFWTRYGRIVAVLVVVGLAALGGWLWWQHDRERKAGADGEVLTQALADVSEGKSQAAAPRLAALAQSPRDGYRASSRLIQAAGAVERNDMKAAIAQYAAIVADAGMPQPFRDLALVRQTMLEFDTLPPERVVARLKGVAVPGNPWFGSAGELVAAAYLKQGDRARAARTFAAVAGDQGVPQSIRARATRLAAVPAAAPAAAASQPANKGN